MYETISIYFTDECHNISSSNNNYNNNGNNGNSNSNLVALVREWTIPTDRPSLVGEISANVCRERERERESRMASAMDLYGCIHNIVVRINFYS
jgi:hypothetical protein